MGNCALKMAEAHVQFLKTLVERDVNEVLEMTKASTPRTIRRSSLTMGKVLEGTVLAVRKETIKNPATGKHVTVNKVFVTNSQNLTYRNMGWVHRGDITNCMVCNSAFGVLNKKHNCTACGLVVCQTCSNRNALIPQLQAPSLSADENNLRFRVCKRCHKGAVCSSFIF